MRARSEARADATGQLELVWEKRLERGSNFAVKCTAVGNVFLRLVGVHFSVSENIHPFNPYRMPTSESLRNLCDSVCVMG